MEIATSPAIIACAIVDEADLVVFVGGLSARIEGEEMPLQVQGFSGGDRTSLDLPEPQQALLERVQARMAETATDSSVCAVCSGMNGSLK